ncbi:MAG: glycosyltransferase family 39 protein [Patescibacteria group bacterium]|nr:glycosyltransferase family 39 protein [Patescibacteria group bacterium]
MIFIISVLFLCLFGFVSVLAIDSQNKYSFFEKTILSFSLGAAVITQIMLLGALLRVDFNILVINSIFGILLFSMLAYSRVKKRKLNIKELKHGRKSLVSRLIFLIIIFQIFFVTSEAILRPVYGFDALDNWAIKAKSFFYEKSVNLDKTDQYFMGGPASKANYPLHISFLAAWFYFNQGEIKENLINLIPAIYYISLLGLIYINLKKYISRRKALIFTLFLSTAPLLIYHGFNYYADLPIAFCLTAAIIYLYNYLRREHPGDLLLGAMMCGAMVFIKNNGLFYAFIILAIFLFELWRLKKIKSLHKKNLAISIAGFLVFSLPWIIYVYINKLGYTTISENRLTPGNFHPEIIKLFFMNLWFTYDFFIWFAVLLIFIFIFIKTTPKILKSKKLFIIITFFALLAFHFSFLLFTDLYVYLLDGTLDGRLSLIIFPLSVFMAGIFYEKPSLPQQTRHTIIKL